LLFDEKLELTFQRLQTVMLGVKISGVCIVEEETFQHIGFAG
jgi:hypothetical protein